MLFFCFKILRLIKISEILHFCCIRKGFKNSITELLTVTDSLQLKNSIIPNPPPVERRF